MKTRLICCNKPIGNKITVKTVENNLFKNLNTNREKRY